MSTSRGPSSAPEFRRLFEAIPVPILILDPGLVMIAMNDAYLAVARKRREDLLGRTPMEAFPDNPDDPQASGVANLTASLRAVLATGRPDTMALQRYDVQASPGGPFEERYWSPVNTPALNPDGTVAFIIHRVEEVTDYVRLRGEEATAAAELRTRAGRLEADLIGRAREVQEANRQLREANDELAAATLALRRQQGAKDRFIALLSHELRNPLAGIRAAVELLSLDVPAGHPSLGVLDRQVGALVRMTDDLLDSSRALTGRLTIHRQRLDLREVVAAVCGDMQPQFAAREQALSVAVPPAEVPVAGDRVRLAQLTGNLLRNALTYTPPGGAVQVELAASGGQAILTVRDDGIGFDPAEADSLFEVFSRGLPSGALSRPPGSGEAGSGEPGPGSGETGPARTGGPPPAPEAPGGLGLGLGLVRSIADLHGGRVVARSDGPGTGATFEVLLPLSGPAAPEPARAPAAPRPVSAGLRALIVEDNADLADTYRVLLQRRGDRAQVAHTGREALAAVAATPFDVILCDIGLPDLDGREVARALAAHPRRGRMRLVAVSGFSQPADRDKALRAGFDAYLVKPMSLADLDAVLAGWPE